VTRFGAWGYEQAEAEIKAEDEAKRARPFSTWKDNEESALICVNAAPHSVSDIPPRPWAYGDFLLFGEAGAIGAVDGGGKSAQAVVIALSMITGQPLLGERVWRKGPVAIISYEDDATEWQRRIAAACMHYGLDYETMIVSFYFISRPGGRVSFAAHSLDGSVRFPDGDAVVQQLKDIGAAMLIIDPYNHCHMLEDGNSNALMAQVASEIARVAQQSGVAALILHHLRKGSTGIVDDLMGATSLRATFRACRILQRMTEEEAEKLGLPRRQAWRHSKIAGNKENYAPPPDTAVWYRLESVALGNCSDLYPDGDNVQVTTTWSPPSPFAGISMKTIKAIFDSIRVGAGNGEFYSPTRRAKRWVGDLLIELADKSADDAARIVKAWIENGVLIKEDYVSPERRMKVGRVILNESKVAEILKPAWSTSGTDE
jgi:hypothetical protein